MKKIFTTLVVLASFATATNAQYKSILVYGTGSMNSYKDAGDNSTMRSYFTPGIGYQFSNELTAGVNLSVASTKFTPNAGTSSATTSSFGFGPFVRYTHPFNNYFGVYGQANVSILANSANGTAVGSGVNANIQPSAYVNLKNGFALNFTFGSLAYNTEKVKGATNGSGEFDINFGQAWGVGMSKNFAAKVRK